MKWKLTLPGNDLSVYEFASSDGSKFSCKHNISSGSLRLKHQDFHSVFNVDPNTFSNRKVVLSNVYGSEVATVTKNVWRENTGQIVFSETKQKLSYSIDPRSSFMELNEGNNVHICDFGAIPHPGREEHYIPVLIALAWISSILCKEKIKEAVS